jgi:transcriptional regulator with XRE-family HTH domain
MDINEKLKLIREKLTLSQEIFAKELNMRRDAYAKVENGANNPTLKLITIVINRYKINPCWLFLGVGDMFEAPQKNNHQNMLINGDFNHASQVMTLQDCSEQLTDKNQKIEHLRDEVKKLQAQVDILKDVLNSK